MAEQLDHSVSFYTVGPAATALTRAKDTADLLRNSLATVTNITVANIATIDGVIKAFEDYKELPGIENLNKKVHGTNLIDPLLDEMDIYIDHIEALVNSYFPKSELADELALTSRVSLLGIRHNAVTVHFTDADTAAIITTATATHIASGKTAAADASGTAYFERISQGIQNFSAAANGYTTQNFSAKISRGTNTDVVVAMKKA